MKSPKQSGKTQQKMKIMSPYQKLQEIQKIPKKSLPKIPQKLPKRTPKLMHKKQRKLSTLEVKTTTYTQTTETHIDTEKTIQETQRLFSNTTASFAVTSLTFGLFVFLQTKDWKVLLFVSITEEETKLGKISQNKIDTQICKQQQK